MNAEEIFHKAMEIEDATERAAYLERACGADGKLRAEVEALLKAHERAGDFLESPAMDAAATLDGAVRLDGPGTRIGHYELLNLIGEGGMGLVYLAEQKEPIRRKVALKIIKPGMDSRQVVARFEAERQALALLDHPNIAHVFDAGCTETGRPYFVMEYVKGLPITHYCDHNKVTIEQRLRLFEQVCEAVHHAHQKGIIHRDLKPSNILVSVHGDRAVPKIIDFGIAKAITQPLTDKTFVTFQGQLLGTPEYMSPEQVDLATQDIDTRSDIYSLGVVLYELLAGVLPFEAEFFERAGLAEIQQTIREQEPASPSIRLTNLGEKAKTIAASRGTQVVPLARRLHRELEWIPLKAMRKDRCRRYRSASEMADDIRNYLTGLPLLAGPETAMYRVQKFVHKHAGSVATVALVAAAIILGLVVSTIMYFRAEASRVQTEQEKLRAVVAEKAEQVQRVAAENAMEDAKQAQRTAEGARQRAERTSYFNMIGRASSELANRDLPRASLLLESCQRDLRGWEWNYLWGRLRSAGDVLPVFSFGGPSRGIALSPNGERIAAWHPSLRPYVRWYELSIWDVATGSERVVIREPGESISPVAWGPKGDKLALGGKTIRIWDLATGSIVTTISGYSDPITSMAFSPDGKRILSGSWDGRVVVWDAATGKEVLTLSDRAGFVTSVAYSPTGEHILAVSTQHLNVWSTSGEPFAKLAQSLPGPIGSATWSPDGRRIACRTRDKVGIYDVATGEALRVFAATTMITSEVAFDPKGRRVVWGDWNGSINVQDLESSSQCLTVRLHRNSIHSVAFRNDREVVSADLTMVSVCRLDAIDNRLARVVHLDGPPSESRFVAAAFSSDRKQVVFAGSKLCIQDVEDAKGTRVIDVDLFVPRGVALTSNKAYVAAWDQENITVRDCQSGDEVWKIDSNDQRVSVAFSPDCKSIALGFSKSFPSIWDLSKKTKTQILKANTNFSSSRVVVFSPDGKSLATNESGTIIVYDLESGTERCRFEGAAGSVTHLAFSSDGKRILAGGPYTVQLSDAGSGATISRCSVTGSEGGIDISPDGRRIVSAAGPMVSLWDADTGSEILSLNAESRIAAVGFSRDPDGKRIMAACIDGTIRIWDSANGDQMDDARDWHARGVVRLRNEETELAISAFTSAIETDPKNADSYRNRAFLYERRRETDKAIEDLQTAIQLGQEAPATSEAMLHLAVLYEQSNRSDDAEQQYQQILARVNKKPPNDVEIALAAMSGLSCIHARQGHHDEAKKLYSTLLDSCSRTQDGDAWSWYTFDLPSTYRTLGDYKREKETRLTLLALLPQTNIPAEDHATAMNDMAWLCATCLEADCRDGELALKCATKACELDNRRTPSYLNTLAAAYAETGDFKAAIKSQQEAITLIDQGSAVAGEERAGYEARLKLYQEGQPCREAPAEAAKGDTPKWTKAMR